MKSDPGDEVEGRHASEPSWAGETERLDPDHRSTQPFRFVPGSVLANRYRIVSLLGRGGMGEVYRADDLELGQPVALKFMPEIPSKSERRLKRALLNEVRVARQVSHSNVCRVYDIGESEGRSFVSMEYVDGEDLSSLLQRIGRLPQEKALQVAHQLCRGLAAVHAKGILFRDLKPSNVMIDGHGRVRITDFGVAALAREVRAGAPLAGTPGYMAPEQLASGETTAKSDLYSLGLVLYELFTGEKPFQARSIEDLKRAQREPPRPSALVQHLDGAVEEAILRCLEFDPSRRPESAQAVAAMLPGAGSLAATLGAGETPLPSMVADAGETGRLGPALGIACLISILLSLAGVLFLSSKVFLAHLVPLELPPEALSWRAREVLQTFGYDELPASRASGFGVNRESLELGASRDSSAARPGTWETLRPSPLFFWYRQSSQRMVPANGEKVTLDDPPLLAGISTVRLDPSGRLVGFLSTQQVAEGTETLSGPPDWRPLFEASGLEWSRFTPVEPAGRPLVFSDARAAWEGRDSDRVAVPLRVEAGAYQGRFVYFRMGPPEEETAPLGPQRPRTGINVALTIYYGLFFLGLAFALLLVFRNFRRGRVDRQGALRLFCFMLPLSFLGWALRADYSSLGEGVLVVRALAESLFWSGLVWLLYAAIEPHVRRLWPDVLISWSRLLAGRLTDPLVGRDVLIGILTGILLVSVILVSRLLPEWLGFPSANPWVGSLDPLLGIRHTAGQLLAIPWMAAFNTLAIVLLVILFRVLLGRGWAAFGLALACFTAVDALSSDTPAGWLVHGLFWAIALLVIFRFGVLASVVGFFWFFALFAVSPPTYDLSAWYASASLFPLFALAVLAAYSFRVALARRPLSGDGILAD